MTNVPHNDDVFNARSTLDTPTGSIGYYRLARLVEDGIGHVEKLPFSIKILLENALRNIDHRTVSREDVENLAGWNATDPGDFEIPYRPSRVILQDLTGVPAVVDLAALRSAMHRMGGDPSLINPVVPVDLVIDHSVQVDYFASEQALMLNAELEFRRNRERYEFLKWGQSAFDNFRVVPPATGIVHQVNLEYLATVVSLGEDAQGQIAIPDTLVGTDSHTTMINGLGVLGWGVGGIEAEAAMLGQPIYMLMPEVIGFKFHGKLQEGVTATDMTLTVVQMLREKGVVGKFVEFYGTGLSNISLPDRATLANMAPEYGATMGFFPIDDEALAYLRRTARDKNHVTMVEAYAKAQGLFRTDDTPDPIFTDTMELDLSTVEPSLAGPKRPQDRVTLASMQEDFRASLTNPVGPKGFGLGDDQLDNTGTIKFDSGDEREISHGAVVIAAITSCTNTSNPSVMLGAGLLAKKAVERGLSVPRYVKTSLAPGSKVVTAYLEEAGLVPYLEALGFHTVGYGCTTCIGNSGPLAQNIMEAVDEGSLVVGAVLSGNRNFEGRIHAYSRANYLASPPLVIAYALAGTFDIDLQNEPIGTAKDGEPVYLKDIWPSQQEIMDTVGSAIKPEMFIEQYGRVYTDNETWNAVPNIDSQVYPWNEKSTYIQEPPFFVDLTPEVPPIQSVEGARVLALLPDSITTDHISPAGSIAKDSPAARYLFDHGVELKDFNSYGSRRGNDRVMTRGTFANIRLKNLMADGREGGWTKYLPTGEIMSIYDAAMKYKANGTPLVIIAGKEYGTGSSRDWAAKGPLLQGVRAVIAESYERIHRSNLVFMGVMPLQFQSGDSAESLGLDGSETFDIHIPDDLHTMQLIDVNATKPSGATIEFQAIARVDTPIEIDYYRHGGILHNVLRDMAQSATA